MVNMNDHCKQLWTKQEVIHIFTMVIAMLSPIFWDGHCYALFLGWNDHKPWGNMGVSINGEDPKVWLVYFMDNPNLKWMIYIGLLPWLRKPPYHCFEVTYTNWPMGDLNIDLRTNLPDHDWFSPIREFSSVLADTLKYIYIYTLYTYISLSAKGCLW